MILCDIGNSYLHFYQRGLMWKESVARLSDSRLKGNEIYYISVNRASTKRLLEVAPHAHDLAPYMTLDSAYTGLGIDRIAACKGIEDGIIVDAGSAITVDIVQNNIHLGGYIMPGIASYIATFRAISPALKHELNLSVDLGALPQNTRDAMSFGVVKSLVLTIQDSCKNKRLFFTGGDGKYLARFFENSIYDNSIVFKGMIKTLEELKERRRSR